MDVWCAAACPALWCCEADAGTCCMQLIHADSSTTSSTWMGCRARRLGQQQVCAAAEQAQWRARPTEGRHCFIVCSVAHRRGAARCPAATAPACLQLWIPVFNW